MELKINQINQIIYNYNNICFWLSLFFDFFFSQVCLAFGTLILFAGLIVVLVGYATPAKIEAFGEDDLLFVDRYRNSTMYEWERI